MGFYFYRGIIMKKLTFLIGILFALSTLGFSSGAFSSSLGKLEQAGKQQKESYSKNAMTKKGAEQQGNSVKNAAEGIGKGTAKGLDKAAKDTNNFGTGNL